MIEIRDVSKWYDKEQILNRVSFTVKKGDFFALFGPDDAGKSTLLHILMGFDTDYQGSAEMFGKKANILNVHERNQVRFVPDDIIWESNSTASSYLKFIQAASIRYNMELQETLCSEFEIPLEEKLLEMTYQQNKLVQIVGAVCAEPNFLILDEPANFLEQKTYRRLLEYLKKWNQLGMGILIAVEKYADVRGICKSYAYLKEGIFVAMGNVSDNDVRCKVVTITDGNAEYLEKNMEQCIEEHGNKKIYLYKREMNRLADILSKSECSDWIVEEMTLEEELESDFSRWE